MKNHFSNASLDTKSSIACIVIDQMLERQVLICILIKLYFAKVYNFLVEFSKLSISNKEGKTLYTRK